MGEISEHDKKMARSSTRSLFLKDETNYENFFYRLFNKWVQDFIYFFWLKRALNYFLVWFSLTINKKSRNISLITEITICLQISH